jgi:hypothetical protein
MLRARFSELAESMDVALSVRRQTGKFYFTVTGTWENTDRFIARTFPEAWVTSAAGDECVYGLPVADVERVLAELQTGLGWLRNHDPTPVQIARHIRDGRAFHLLPVLADALEEEGCTSAEILDHCRASAPHGDTCWVVELLLGPDRKRRRSPRPDEEGGGGNEGHPRPPDSGG